MPAASLGEVLRITEGDSDKATIISTVHTGAPTTGHANLQKRMLNWRKLNHALTAGIIPLMG